MPEGSGKGKRGHVENSAVLVFSHVQRINAVAITLTVTTWCQAHQGQEIKVDAVQSKLFSAELQSQCTQSTQLLQHGLNQSG